MTAKEAREIVEHFNETVDLEWVYFLIKVEAHRGVSSLKININFHRKLNSSEITHLENLGYEINYYADDFGTDNPHYIISW